MKSSALFAAAVSATTVLAQIRFPFSRQQHSASTTTTKIRSATKNNKSNDRRTLPLKIFGEQYTYAVNASVGTPPQNMTLALTLSADESWVIAADEYYYDWGYGAFASENSSTFVGPDKDGEDSFSVSYGDGTYVYGDQVRETMWLGGMPLPNLTMGLADYSSSYMGVLALGFNDSYSDVPNVPDLLLSEGLIASTAFSLWLDDASAASGNVLFGAVDRAAFEPPLVRFPLSEDTYYSYYSSSWYVQLSSLNYSRTASGALQPLVANQTAIKDVIVSVDPTFSTSTLPLFIAQPIWDMVGAVYDSYEALALVPCDAAKNATGRLALQLYGPDGPVIDIPVSDLVLDSTWVDRDPETDAKRCIFGVQNSTTDPTSSTWGYEQEWSLGAPMLKRMYTVFDIANREMGLASVKFGVGAEEEDVVPFPSYAAEIPESTLVTVVCDERYDYCPDDDDDDGGSGSTSSSSDGYYPGLSGGALIGVVVAGIVAGALVTLGIIWGAMLCARRRQLAKIAAADKEKGPAAGQPEQAPPLPPRAAVTVDAERGGALHTAIGGVETLQTNEERGEPSQSSAEKTKALEPMAEGGETSQVGAGRVEGSQPNIEEGETSQTAAEKATAVGPNAEKEEPLPANAEEAETSKVDTGKAEASQTNVGKPSSSS